MARSLPLVLRAATRQWVVSAHSRGASNDHCVRALATAASTSSSPPPPPPLPTSSSSSSSSSTPTSSDPALHKIVDDISSLTLLQAADLVTLLKTRLNIQEIVLPMAGAAAPSAGAAGTASDADETGAEEAAKPKEKTIFNIKLESFDAGAKPKVIKEVKAIVPNLTLIEAKKFVESVPKILKEAVSKEDAEKIKKAFEAHGAVVILE
ncbi:ribosomal protein L7/L12 C-terminal domain-containing protein [Lactifluus volemus]|nr:ribosomal protein L7/L12 C-terminal domain-containing protein [Lactifluus volemus]